MTVILMLRTMYDGRRYPMQHDLLRDFPKLCVTAYTMLENSRLQRIWGLNHESEKINEQARI